MVSAQKGDGNNIVDDSHRSEGCKKTEYNGATVVVFCAYDTQCKRKVDDPTLCRCGDGDVKVSLVIFLVTFQ